MDAKPLDNRIEETLSRSSLNAQDQSLWRDRLSVASEKYLNLFIDLFSKAPELLPQATQTLKDKVAAGDSLEKWMAIAKREYQELRDVLQSNKE